MKFEPLVEKLQEELGLKPGTDLFINQMPATVKKGVLLRETYGGTEIDGYIPDMRRGRFQVAVRGKGYSEGYALAEAISEVLTLDNVTLTGLQVKNMRPISEPAGFALSDANNYEFLVNFVAIYGIVRE